MTARRSRRVVDVSAWSAEFATVSSIALPAVFPLERAALWPAPFVARFLSKIDFPADGDLCACWPWLGAFSRGGTGGAFRNYGAIKGPGGRVFRAIRGSLSLADGVALERRGDLEAGHAPFCARPACVNPGHLEWCTKSANIREMVERREARRLEQEARERALFVGLS